MSNIGAGIQIDRRNNRMMLNLTTIFMRLRKQFKFLNLLKIIFLIFLLIHIIHQLVFICLHQRRNYLACIDGIIHLCIFVVVCCCRGTFGWDEVIFLVGWLVD